MTNLRNEKIKLHAKNSKNFLFNFSRKLRTVLQLRGEIGLIVKFAIFSDLQRGRIDLYPQKGNLFKSWRMFL